MRKFSFIFVTCVIWDNTSRTCNIGAMAESGSAGG